MFRRLRTLWRLSGSDPDEEHAELCEWLQTTNDCWQGAVRVERNHAQEGRTRIEERLTKVENMHGLLGRVQTTTRERYEIMTKRLDTLALRVDVLQPKRDMVPCPACDGKHYGPTTDPTCPHPSCELCQGHGEVPAGVAAYVIKLERDCAGRDLTSDCP